MDRPNDKSELYAREAEECLVAALFGDSASDVFNEISLKNLGAEDFYVPAFGLVLAAFGDLVSNGITPDPSTLVTRLKSSDGFDDKTQAQIEKAISAPYAARNVKAYAEAVLEKSRARRIASMLSGVMARVPLIGGDISSDDLVRELDGVSLQMGERSEQNGLLRTTLDHVSAVVKVMDAVQDGELQGVRTGIRDLDEKLGGMQGGDFVILAARPSMGKSAFALEILLHNCVKNIPALSLANFDPDVDIATLPMGAFFSGEMPEEQLAQRMLANLCGVEFGRLRRSELTDADWVNLTNGIPRYARADIRIDASSRMTPSILRAKIRMLERQTGKKLKFGIVDYLQLMEDDERHQNRASEISAISRKLKLMAKELDIPVIALSQLNRDLEKRTDKRPMMSDLRESGALEQDADTILFLYRDEYYNPDSQAKGLAEVIVGKGRNTGVGMVGAQFQGEYQRFSDMPGAAYTYESTYGGK